MRAPCAFRGMLLWLLFGAAAMIGFYNPADGPGFVKGDPFFGNR